jgi:hypothetical protein
MMELDGDFNFTIRLASVEISTLKELLFYDI